MTTPTIPTRVFLSYARANTDMADRVEQHLLAAGFDVWRDIRCISGMDVWAEAISRGLASSDRLVVVLSKASMVSKEVFPEWFYFYHHRKPLHCVLIEACNIDYHLLPYTYVDARDHAQMALDRLVDDLQKPFTPPFQAAQDVMIISPYAPDQSFEEALKDAMAALTSTGEGAISLTPDMAAQIEAHPPRNMPEYRLGRMAAWCGPRYRLDERFVQLSLLVDQGEEAQ